MRKNVSAMEDKISDNAKNVVKHMDTSEPMTLEDLNSARQTVARIEAMIDVEKHMAELEKLRSERGGSAGHASGLASAIPASALAPMPLPTPTASPSPVGVTHSPLASTPVKPVEKEKPKPVLSNAEISRITGAEGKYSAVLRLANGDMKTVKAGDQVADHATVRWISSSSVVVEENGETHTLHIKNVDAIFSAMR
jgi:type IV pilus biogenesis protein PilP